MNSIDNQLEGLNACKEAREWAKGKSWEEIFSTCERGDWLLWLFKRTNPNDLQKLTLTKGHCAATVLHLMKDERSKNAVKAAISFGEGNIYREDLDAAYAAAYDYASTYASTSDSAAAAASATAAYTAAASATAVASATAAASAAAVASAAAYNSTSAYTAAYTAAKKENLKLTADICRKYLSIEIWNIKLD